MSAKLKPENMPSAEAYKNLVDHFARLTDATNQLSGIETRVQQDWTALVDGIRDEYVILQSEITETEEFIKRQALLHPEWFEAIKTLKTLYGTVAFRRSTKLEVPNEELTIALIERMGPKRAMYLRSRNFLNLEALETLDDRALKRLKIARVTADKCTVTPAKIDLGKAVKKAATAEPVEA